MPIRYPRLLAVLLCAAAVPAAQAEPQPGASWFRKFSMPPPTVHSILVCHGFGCHSRTLVALTAGDRATLSRLVRGRTAEAERGGIAKAVAWFDRRVGPQAGTTGARAFARGLAGDRSQFDCFDRTVNTTALLLVMDQLSLLRHHRVAEPESRMFVPLIGGPHTSAVLQERVGRGQKWVVDPWPHNHGELPDVMPLDRWLAQG